jgi:chorismate mutase
MHTQTRSLLEQAPQAVAEDGVLSPQIKTWYAIRGATTVGKDEKEEILSATRTMLSRILIENDLTSEDIVSAFFVVTRDLTAAYPAEAARQIGWTEVALLCASDMEVTGSISRCVRVLLHVHGVRTRQDVRHVYLGNAASLRPDWAESNREKTP